MNETLRTIAKRVSHRKYDSAQLTKEQLNAIVQAALQSPSAVNRQPWHFSVIQDASLIQRIHDAAAAVAMKRDSSQRSPRYNDSSFQVFYHAPTVIILSAENTHYAPIDCGIAVQTIALAAESMGLGSVILGLPRDAFAGEEKEELERVLGFPEGYSYVIAIALGTPLDTKVPHELKEEKVTYIQTVK